MGVSGFTTLTCTSRGRLSGTMQTNRVGFPGRYWSALAYRLLCLLRCPTRWASRGAHQAIGVLHMCGSERQVKRAEWTVWTVLTVELMLPPESPMLPAF